MKKGPLLRVCSPDTTRPGHRLCSIGQKKSLDSHKGKKVGLLAFQEPKNFLQFHQIEVLSKKGDFREAAANLFSAIRRLDGLHLDLILAEAVPEVGLGRAIMDRIRRASSPLPEGGN